ncbi:MAG TPA: hypothetical protein VFZ34_00265, partial [Blastocatellia bacterium]|nr:hypothetical protein [Blastocatellia bacterium]
YDVFAHFTIPILLAPALFWLIQLWFVQQGYQLPLSSIAFVAINVTFSLAAFYEITEMWDELYFGGHRIWTLHDTTRDLQWDLLGATVGSLLTYAVLKVRQPICLPIESTDQEFNLAKI